MLTGGGISGFETFPLLLKPVLLVVRPIFSIRCMLSVYLRCSNVRLVSVFCLFSVSLRMILFLWMSR